MKEITTEQKAGNKLIARFMGEGIAHGDNHFAYNTPVHYMEYHTSWDWLMPVVEKIEADEYAEFVAMPDNTCSIFGPQEVPPYISHKAATKIEAVWLAVVDFIEWRKQNAA